MKHLNWATIVRDVLIKNGRIEKIEASIDEEGEFIDAKSAAIFVSLVLENYKFCPTVINCGNTEDYSIDSYYQMIADIYGIHPTFEHDLSMPDGIFSKKLDITLALDMGWKPTPMFRKTKADLSTVSKDPSTGKLEPHKWNPGDNYMLSVDVKQSKKHSRGVREFLKQNQKRMSNIKKGKGPVGMTEK